ncbi:MAG: hypothetical protein ACREEC_05120, partial [Thermoplasmata archaeon]
DFFAAYLTHPAVEGRTRVPLLAEHFTDAELLAFAQHVEESMPPSRLAEFTGWMLPALHANELSALFGSMKEESPPEEFRSMVGLAEVRVDPARWAVVRERVGI